MPQNGYEMEMSGSMETPISGDLALAILAPRETIEDIRRSILSADGQNQPGRVE
jgi:hypothetical protein